MADRRQPTSQSIPDDKIRFDPDEPYTCMTNKMERLACDSCRVNQPGGCPLIEQDGFVYGWNKDFTDRVCLGRKGRAGLTVDHSPGWPPK